MRGRLNTAKRLAWVKKTYPEEVYIRTALIALDPDQHAESEKKGPRAHGGSVGRLGAVRPGGRRKGR